MDVVEGKVFTPIRFSLSKQYLVLGIVIQHHMPPVPINDYAAS